MKSFNVVVLGLAVGLVSGLASAQEPKKSDSTSAAAAAPAPASGELKDLRAKASYSIGLSMGRNLKGASIDVDADLIARGIKDALTGGKPLLTDEQLQQVMQEFQQQIVSRKIESDRIAADKNKKDADAYLAANKVKPGVVTTPSGLQYKVVKEGTGAIPKATDTVTTHYRGTLIDGTEFDSSYKRNEPASFPVNGVIKGWTEALQKMKVGSKWQLVIPAALAYGDNPPPGSSITPGAVLLFDIELLGIGQQGAAGGR